jgi:hypothetical protein
MKRQWLNAIVVAVTIFGLSACAQIQREEAAAPMAMAVPEAAPEVEEAYVPWNLYVETEEHSEEIVDVLKDRARARDLLNEMLFGEGSDRRFNDDELAALLRQAQNDETTGEDLRTTLGGSNALSGIAGDSVVQFLHAYVTREPQNVRGKIRKYYFNDDEKGGYLEVDTVVETSQGGSVVDTDNYFWAIAVRSETYRVVDREDPPTTDPFPNTVVFSQNAVNESNPQGIWLRNLDQKLFAEGTGVVVIAVRKNGVLLPTTDRRYVSNSDSCIDLLFWGYPPKSELPKQRFYCMGRCAHPQVVNTDG